MRTVRANNRVHSLPSLLSGLERPRIPAASSRCAAADSRQAAAAARFLPDQECAGGLARASCVLRAAGCGLVAVGSPCLASALVSSRTPCAGLRMPHDWRMPLLVEL